MKKSNLITSASRMIHSFGFAIQKRSPEILVTAGVIGTVASTVLACKATLKATDILEEAHENVQKVHCAVELNGHPKYEGRDEVFQYDDNDARKDLTIIYVQTGLKMLKNYAPALILGTVSIISIVQSHRILRKRNVALATAYTALDKSFKEYRKRVSDRYGDEVEREIHYNLKAQDILETTVDPETGEEVTTSKTVDVIDEENGLGSPYARIFDSSNPNWSKEPSMNLYFIRCQQARLNDTLKVRGHMFLNEVYDALNFPRTKAGAVVGWVYDPRHPMGDNYIDFGIDIQSKEVHDLVRGEEHQILLDFNVEGIILDQVASHQNNVLF